MCGRFNLTATNERISEHFHLTRLSLRQPNYNITPGQKILCIVELDDGSYKGVNLFWGLIPSWSKNRKNAGLLINARAETLTEKPSFKSAYQNRRCLIPATGFYEWRRAESGKQPFHIRYPDERLFAFAGLWEQRSNPLETVYSCAIITTAAHSGMAAVHDRMPVVIKPENYQAWLNKQVSGIEMHAFEQATPYRDMLITPISDRINNPRNNDEACLV